MSAVAKALLFSKVTPSIPRFSQAWIGTINPKHERNLLNRIAVWASTCVSQQPSQSKDMNICCDVGIFSTHIST
jgi:hypothetical protein